MGGEVGPLNPGLRRRSAAHVGGIGSHKCYHGTMAPCLCSLIERQGAQNRSAEVQRREGVWD